MKRIKFYIILIIPIIFIQFAGCNRNQNPYPIKKQKDKMVLNLSGKWKFSLGDNPEWKETKFDDSEWDKVYVPSPWENQGFHGYDGYAWYRTSFDLNSEFKNRDIYLVLGYVDDVDQTYINGNLIGVSGGFPNNYRTAYNAFRKYYIPREYLNYEGENVLAVRVYDSELDGGITNGKVGLYTYENNLEPDINLSGLWQFKTGDDSLFLKNKNSNDEIVNLMVPAHWDIQGYQDYDGFAWYKKSFLLPKEYVGKNLILLLGKIDDIDQTFVNGIFVGSTGKWNFKTTPTEFNANYEYLSDRVYSVPQKILKPGEINTIVVRVYDGYRDGGIYEGPIGLITQGNYKKYSGQK